MTNKLTKLTDVTTAHFLEKVKERYIEKYADDVLVLLEDQKKLQKALNRVNDILAKIEKGDIEAVNEYKKAKKRLEENDEEDL